jgi:putative ABC transport system permease protein
MKFSQIFFVSFESLKTNKLRTFLTILGVVVGIFSIVVIMTIITMLQTSIEEGVSQLNKNTFQIQKWPAIHTGGHSSWAKYRNRKDITLDDFNSFEKMMPQAKYVGADISSGRKVIKFRNNETNPNIQIIGVTPGAFKTYRVNVSEGRDIRQLDIDYTNHICLLGNDVVEKLFIGIDPVGQTIKADGFPLKVVGVLEKQPQLFGQSMDSYIIIPITTYQSFYGKKNRSVSITVMTYSKEDYENTMEAAIGHMRKIRKVDAGKENDFEVFSNESIMSQINDITGGVRIGAIVVSIIALIAAGVGIMNIMLVSVTERTREIGIRKAVGAQKSAILIQFLMEAVVLSLIGGFIGIFLGVMIGNFAGSFLNAVTVIPYDWVIIGLSMCVIVGVTFGTYPAYKAANLDPIEALRYE